jgi:hypothetical protein
MDHNATLAHHDKPARSRAASNSAPCLAIMDRTGRIYTVPWSRATRRLDVRPIVRMLIAKLRARYAHVVQRAQLWWQA